MKRSCLCRTCKDLFPHMDKHCGLLIVYQPLVCLVHRTAVYSRITQYFLRTVPLRNFIVLFKVRRAALMLLTHDIIKIRRLAARVHRYLHKFRLCLQSLSEFENFKLRSGFYSILYNGWVVAGIDRDWYPFPTAVDLSMRCKRDEP